MGAPGLTSPIRPEGFAKLQLNAGVFLKNFPVEHFVSAEALKLAVAAEIAAGTNILGMTSGGGTFTLTREMRLPEVDGRRYPHKGAHFVDSMDGYLTSTLLETTYGNLEALLGKNIPATGDPSTMYRIHTAVDVDDDYLTNIVWIGDLADGEFVAIVVKNAMNTADFSFTFADKNEGKLPFEFHAHQSNVNLYDTAPVYFAFFDNGGEILAYADRLYGDHTAGKHNYNFSEDLPAGDYIVTFYDDTILFQIQHAKTGTNEGFFELWFSPRATAASEKFRLSADHYQGDGIFAVPVTLTQACKSLYFNNSGVYVQGDYTQVIYTPTSHNTYALCITAAPATEEAEEEGD